MRKGTLSAVVGLALVSLALLAWSRCGGTETSPESGPVGSTAPSERAPQRTSPSPRRASGDAPSDAPPAPVEPAPSTPVPGSVKPGVPAESKPPREIVLYVADEGGAPVAGLWAHVDDDGTRERGQRRTDVAGMCRFVAAGGPRRIDIAEKIVPGRCFLPVGDVAVGATQTEVRLRLREGAAIEGRVVDERDAPVVRVNVTALGSDGFNNLISTGAAGEFRLPAPVGSTCDLRLGVPVSTSFIPDEDYDGALEGVAVGTTGIVLRCRRVAKDRALSVLVVDPNGTPRPGAYVAVSLVAYVQGRDADKDGRCRFEGLPARELTAYASTLSDAPDDLYAPALPVKFVPDGQEIVLQLRRAHLVKIALVDAAGAAVAVAGMEIVAKRGTRQVTWGRSDAAGRTTLKIPPEEVGTIRVEVRGVRSKDTAEPLGTADVDVPTEREIRIVVAR